MARLFTCLASLLLGGFLACLALSSSYAQSIPPATTLALSFDFAAASNLSITTTLTGVGFDCGVPIKIQVRNQAISGPDYSVTDKGGFALPITIPLLKTPGVWTIRASQLNTAAQPCLRSAVISFYAFDLAVLPLSGRPGTIVQVAGNNFPPNRFLQFRFRDNFGHSFTFTAVTTNSQGNLSYAAPLPAGGTLGAGTFRIPYGENLGLVSTRSFTALTDLTITHLEFTKPSNAGTIPSF